MQNTQQRQTTDGQAERIAALEGMLRKIVERAAPLEPDSTGFARVQLRRALTDEARGLLARRIIQD